MNKVNHNALDMYNSLWLTSPAQSSKDLYHFTELHNRGKLAYNVFGEIVIVESSTNIFNIDFSAKELFAEIEKDYSNETSHNKFYTCEPSFFKKRRYSSNSATLAATKVWEGIDEVEKSDIILKEYSKRIGDMTRFILAEALSGMKNSIELQYNYVRVIKTWHGSLNKPKQAINVDTFSIMLDKYSYIQMIAFQDVNCNTFIYIRSKVGGVETSHKCSVDGSKSVRRVALELLDKHFQPFVNHIAAAA